jgi:hypothetical protein
MGCVIVVKLGPCLEFRRPNASKRGLVRWRGIVRFSAHAGHVHGRHRRAMGSGRRLSIRCVS